MVTPSATKTADSAGQKPETVKMRSFSFVLAFAFVLAGPTLAGTADGSLPGIGTFAYGSSPIVTAAPSILVAAR
jgi:hypothetical protein